VAAGRDPPAPLLGPDYAVHGEKVAQAARTVMSAARRRPLTAAGRTQPRRHLGSATSRRSTTTARSRTCASPRGRPGPTPSSPCAQAAARPDRAGRPRRAARALDGNAGLVVESLPGSPGALRVELLPTRADVDRKRGTPTATALGSVFDDIGDAIMCFL
jgi:hypothetical protein